EVGHPAPRLLDEQRPGGKVPCLRSDFPVALHLAERDGRQVQRRRTHQADPRDACEEVCEVVEVDSSICHVAGESGGERGLVEAGRPRDAPPAAAPPRPPPPPPRGGGPRTPA